MREVLPVPGLRTLLKARPGPTAQDGRPLPPHPAALRAQARGRERGPGQAKPNAKQLTLLPETQVTAHLADLSPALSPLHHHLQIK